jgi:hypothetical protein
MSHESVDFVLRVRDKGKSVRDELELEHHDGDVVDISKCFGHHAAVGSLLKPSLPAVLAQRLSQLLCAFIVVLDIE